MNIDIYVQNDRANTCVARHACVFFFGDICDLMSFFETSFPCSTFLEHARTLGTFEPFAAHLTDSGTKTVKTVFFIWPDIDLTRDLDFKTLT